MFKRRQWIKIAENIILFSVLFLIFWCHFFFRFLGVNMRWDANSLSARMLHLLHQFVPDLYSVTLILPTSLNTAYSLSPQRRLSSASIKFLWLRQIHDPTAISPALDNALSTLLSCCSQHFIPLYIFFRWSRSVTTTVNKPQRRQAFACRLF